MGKVYLVGAGPGDAGLITVRGIEILKRCDAVVYDRLVSEEIFACVRRECRKIYVGKKPGRHDVTQEEINRILIKCAARYETVVRLKGGDPFVFGRGREEVEVLLAHNIDFEVVPGVTSAVAVPECAGIPVTHRGMSRSFHVIAGHTNRGLPICDYRALTQAGGTLVFLMGLAHIDEIADGLLSAGMTDKMPAAVISAGADGICWNVRGTLGTIARRIREQDVAPPAVLVVGETVSLGYQGGKRERRVGVAATPHLYRKLAASLHQAGMKAVWVCQMQVRENKQSGLLEEFAALGGYRWVIFTSANGVKIFFETARREQIDWRRFGHLKFAALGGGTAQKLAEYGFNADFVPSVAATRTFAEEFAHVVSAGEDVLIPRAKEGSRELTEVLKQRGIAYTDLPVYGVKGVLTKCAGRLETLDYLVFVSASGVRDFFEGIGRRELLLPQELQIACIGEVTARALRRYGRKAGIVSQSATVEGLTRAIAEYEENRGE